MINLYAPHRCLSCKNDGDLLCFSCAEAELIPKAEVCYRCNKLSTYFKTCKSCRPSSFLSHVYVGYEYSTVAKDLIWSLKFNRAQIGAKYIAHYLEKQLPENQWDVVCHVPTSPKRVRQRGYDQSKLIAKNLASLIECKYEPLLWRMDNSRQVGKQIEARKNQALSAFEPRLDVACKKILVVDDVMASGATMEAIAKILKTAGAKKVDGAVFARS